MIFINSPWTGTGFAVRVVSAARDVPVRENLGNISRDGQRFVFAINVPAGTASADKAN
jgi:hypothetical protein